MIFRNILRRASEFAILRRTRLRIAGPRLGQGVVAGLSTEVILDIFEGKPTWGGAKSWEIYRGMLWFYMLLDDLYSWFYMDLYIWILIWFLDGLFIWFYMFFHGK